MALDELRDRLLCPWTMPWCLYRSPRGQGGAGGVEGQGARLRTEADDRLVPELPDSDPTLALPCGGEAAEIAAHFMHASCT